eukprot:2092602-Amphidinium_carterae.1
MRVNGPPRPGALRLGGLSALFRSNAFLGSVWLWRHAPEAQSLKRWAALAMLRGDEHTTRLKRRSNKFSGCGESISPH